MDQKFIKFYRVAALPATGEVGGLYFVYTEGNVGKLYVCTTGTNFELYSGVHASELTTALNDYVLKTQTIAGIDLQDSITVEELQTALGLGTAAYKAVEDFDAAGAAEAVKTALVNGELEFIDFKAVGDELRALEQNAGAKVADVTVGGTSVVNAEHVAVLGTAASKAIEDFDAAGAAATALEDAKKYTDEAKAAVIGDATEAGDTLGKLEDRIEAIVANEKTYSVVKMTAEEVAALGNSNVKEAYKLIDEDNEAVGEPILVYKDSSLKSAAMGTDGDAQKLMLTYILADGSESVVPVDLSAFYAESETGDGLQVVDHVISVKRDEASEAFLSVSEAGVKLSGVQDAIDTAKGEAIAAIAPAIAELDAEVTSTDGTKVTVKVTEVDGKITAVNVTESDIASDARLAEIELVTSYTLNEHYAQLVDHENRITTLEGAVEDLEGALADKNVAAEGDNLVSASAADNKVTVAATQDLKDAVEAANSAVQSVASAGETVQVTRTENAVSLDLVWQLF